MTRPLTSAGANVGVDRPAVLDRRAGLDRDAVISAAVACREDVLRVLGRKYARFPLADIEDCFSSAFESLFAQPESYFRERFASGSVVKAWLIRAAGNDLLNADAKWSRRVVTVDPTESLTLIDLVAGSDIPGVVFPDDERNKANQYARLIPEADREIAHLAFFDRLKTAEIAAALGMESLAVQRTIDRARKTVRRRLGDEITESTLCQLVAPDLAVLRETGEFTPALREHLRSCRACELAVVEASGRAIHAVLPPAGGGGLLAWLLRHTLHRSGRAVAVHASMGGSSTAVATTTASATASPVLAGAGAIKAGVVIAAAVVAAAGSAHAVHVLTRHHRHRPPAAHVATVPATSRALPPVLPSAPKPKPKPSPVPHRTAARHRTRPRHRTPATHQERPVNETPTAASRHLTVATTTPTHTTTPSRTTSTPARVPAATKTPPAVARPQTATRTTGAGLSPTGPVSRVRP